MDILWIVFLVIILILTIITLSFCYDNLQVIKYYDTNRKYCDDGDRFEKDFEILENIKTGGIKALTIVTMVFIGLCVAIYIVYRFYLVEPDNIGMLLFSFGALIGPSIAVITKELPMSANAILYILIVLSSVYLIYAYVKIIDTVSLNTHFIILSALLLLLYGILYSKISNKKFNRDYSDIIKNSELVLNSAFANSFQSLPITVKDSIVKRYIRDNEANNPGTILTYKDAEIRIQNEVNDVPNKRVNYANLIKYMTIPGDITLLNEEYHLWSKTNCAPPDQDPRPNEPGTTASFRHTFPYKGEPSNGVACKKHNNAQSYLSTYITDNYKDINSAVSNIIVYVWFVFIVILYLLFINIYNTNITMHLVGANIIMIGIIFLYYMFFVRE